MNWIEKNRKIRKEFERIKPDLWKKKGKICFYCKKTATQLHHIWEIDNGGDNRDQNIVPVCASCHDGIHGGKGALIKGKYTGRPKKEIPPGYRTVLEKYFKCEIGMNEVKEILRLSHGARVTEQWFYNAYKKELGIAEYKRIAYNKKYSQAVILYNDGHIEEWTNGKMTSKRR